MPLLKKRHATKRRRVKFNNTRRRVHVYTPTELSPIPKPDIFDRMMAKMNARKLTVPGKYLLVDRHKVASAAKSRLAIQHKLGQLRTTLKNIPENDEIAFSTLLSRSGRSRYNSKRTPSSFSNALPPSEV